MPHQSRGGSVASASSKRTRGPSPFSSTHHSGVCSQNGPRRRCPRRRSYFPPRRRARAVARSTTGAALAFLSATSAVRGSTVGRAAARAVSSVAVWTESVTDSFRGGPLSGARRALARATRTSRKRARRRARRGQDRGQRPPADAVEVARAEARVRPRGSGASWGDAAWHARRQTCCRCPSDGDEARGELSRRRRRCGFRAS